MSDISKIKVGETTYDIKDQAGREAFANSKVSVLDDTSDTDHIPTAKAVYDYGQSIKNSIASGGSGADELARKLLGHGRTKISVFSSSNYTNVQSNSSLSPWFENYYKKVDSYVSVSDGSRDSSYSHYITAMEITMGEPSSLGSSYTTTIEKGLVKQTYVYNSGDYYYTYSVDMSGTSIPVAIQLTNQITVTIDGVTYYYPQGMYFYNNISEQKFVYSVVAYYDGLDTFRTALSQFNTRTSALEDALENQGGSGSGGAASGYNLADYYAVNTINVVPSMLTEGTPSLNGFYKLSDYNNKDGLFRIQRSSGDTSLDWVGELVNISLVAQGEPVPPAYVPLTEAMFYLFPEDTTFTAQTGTDSEGQPIYEEFSVTAGIYGLVDEDITYIITCLEKKDKFLVQKEYQFDMSATPILNAYFKCSDDTDIEGLFTANTVTAFGINESGIPSISLDYCTGGHFKPMSYFAPEFNVPTIYALEGALYAGDVSAVVVTELTEIPEEFMGTAMTLQPGTYLALVDEVPYLTLRKLQEKETLLDLDEKLGAHAATGSSLFELVLGGLETSETGEFNLSLTYADMEKGTQHAKEIYNILKTALEQRGSVTLRLSEMDGYIDFIMKTHLIKFEEKYNSVCSGSTYFNGMWLDISLQIVTCDTDLKLLCKAKATLSSGG